MRETFHFNSKAFYLLLDIEPRVMDRMNTQLRYHGCDGCQNIFSIKAGKESPKANQATDGYQAKLNTFPPCPCESHIGRGPSIPSILQPIYPQQWNFFERSFRFILLSLALACMSSVSRVRGRVVYEDPLVVLFFQKEDHHQGDVSGKDLFLGCLLTEVHTYSDSFPFAVSSVNGLGLCHNVVVHILLNRHSWLREKHIGICLKWQDDVQSTLTKRILILGRCHPNRKTFNYKNAHSKIGLVHSEKL
ncbi:hypothetical protein M569_00065 [Genlisea aurea]|uniref:Uncharacterized protein n=1 Tax=Genlisea aurea TaxID=192259 RepID=S8D5J0_9LAMI|nr:hypothetical protein M569_00065 [Genlisea aurea]